MSRKFMGPARRSSFLNRFSRAALFTLAVTVDAGRVPVCGLETRHETSPKMFPSPTLLTRVVESAMAVTLTGALAGAARLAARRSDMRYRFL